MIWSIVDRFLTDNSKHFHILTTMLILLFSEIQCCLELVISKGIKPIDYIQCHYLFCVCFLKRRIPLYTFFDLFDQMVN